MINKINEKEWVRSLSEVKEILDRGNIKYWLDEGTLLGAVRDSKFIFNDTDIDFGMVSNEAKKVIKKITEIEKRGYKVCVTDSSIYLSRDVVKIGIGFYRIENDKAWILFLKKNPKMNFILKYFDRIADRAHYRDFHRGLPALEMLLYKLMPKSLDYVVRKILFGICHIFGQRDYAMVLPKSTIEKFKIITFYGMQFAIPDLPQEYLRLIYGENWKIPNPDWKWSDVKAIDYSFFKNEERADYSLI
ncbi:MAG: LicD family protein [Promethearchaeota archaeon]